MSSSLATDFGPNDWFVQEKYEEFLADPQSVEPIWRDFFAQTTTGASTTAARRRAANAAARAVPATDRPVASPPLSPVPGAAASRVPQQVTADRPADAWAGHHPVAGRGRRRW